MNNLHAPTVPSGPTSAVPTNDGLQHLGLAQLSRKKNDMETELRVLSRVLDSHGVDMDTPLLTDDGFPRADIDVAQVRTTRTRIIHLRNDYKELMNRIAEYLQARFAEGNLESETAAPASAAHDVPGDPTSTPTPHDHVPARPNPPFSRVNSVAEGSPAEQAGLQAGDEIRNFGYVSMDNHDGLRKVAECVRANEGQVILIKVCRGDGSGSAQELQLDLTPRRDWGGRGLLGCHILPI